MNISGSPHSFHIPVMGTGFTVDTPLKVARYGISSVVSIVDDELLEKMRRVHSLSSHQEYVPILRTETDARARRISAYLNLLDRLVHQQMEVLIKEPFIPESDIRKYFEMLDDTLEEKQMYRQMLNEPRPRERQELEQRLRAVVVPGSIDVNIMVKVDRDRSPENEPSLVPASDAMAALRGYAESTLQSSVVFSAGFNPRVYSYVSTFADFFPDHEGFIKKKVVLKVSDYRSALIQGRFFAKKAIWVSEFRIESGLNCGGHAFPTDGHLLGPVLEEFKQKRAELIATLWNIYQEALQKTGHTLVSEPPPVNVTTQGGIGTNAEQRFLKRNYQVSSIGWGTPFLLVPEATEVDEKTLKELALAGEKDIILSDSSPLDIPFYTLKNSQSEALRRHRIAKGRPGSFCPSGYLAFNTEFGRPLCTASYAYQAKKIRQIREEHLDESGDSQIYQKVVAKACICHDLGAGALLKYDLKDSELGDEPPAPAVCPGPNLAFFSKICSLSEMVGHIYGRTNLISSEVHRPHAFINELRLYMNYLQKISASVGEVIDKKRQDFLAEFRKNLLDGIQYYKRLNQTLVEESEEFRKKMLEDLCQMETKLCASMPLP